MSFIALRPNCAVYRTEKLFILVISVWTKKLPSGQKQLKNGFQRWENCNLYALLPVRTRYISREVKYHKKSFQHFMTLFMQNETINWSTTMVFKLQGVSRKRFIFQFALADRNNIYKLDLVWGWFWHPEIGSFLSLKPVFMKYVLCALYWTNYTTFVQFIFLSKYSICPQKVIAWIQYLTHFWNPLIGHEKCCLMLEKLL